MKKTLIWLAAMLLVAVTLHADVLYVDQSVSTPGTGTSWTTAFADLQPALESATSGDEIRVAKGVYKPTQTQDRNRYFAVTAGISVFGGYPPGGGIRNPDPTCNETILTGDLLGDDAPSFTNTSDNCRRVVNIDGGTLDGFTIRDGNEDISMIGGALRATGSATLTNLLVCDNQSANSGGGLSGGAFTMRDSIVSGNRAAAGGGAYIGASPLFERVRFTENLTFQKTDGSQGYGAGVLVIATGGTPAAPVFLGCQFLGNWSERLAATAIIFANSRPAFINCKVAGNLAASGGGIQVEELNGVTATPLVDVVNCAFVDNTNLSGAASVGIYANGGTTKIVNSLFWKCGIAGTAINALSVPNHIEGIGGAADPLLVRLPDSGDGDWATVADNNYGDLRLLPGSPLHNSGVNAHNSQPVDIDGALRIQSGMIDIGPYEGPYTTLAIVYPALDPDLDANDNGLTNYFEYAAGYDPTAYIGPASGGSQAAAPILIRDSAGLQIIAKIRIRAADVYSVFETSADNIHWDSAKEFVNYVVTANAISAVAPRLGRTILLSNHEGLERQFYRLKFLSVEP